MTIAGPDGLETGVMVPAGRAELVLDDGAVRVVYRPGRSHFLLVTFSEMGMRPDGMKFWAGSLAETLDLSCIGIVAYRPDWFPALTMRTVAAATSAVRGGFGKVVLYGASMGGYAALKYSKLLNATAAVALCPQFSIDPAIAGSFDPRYSQWFRAGDHSGMHITADDVAGTAWLFHDPVKTDDSKHVAMILDAISPAHAARSIYVPFVGHDVPQALAGTATLTSLLQSILADDRGAVQRIARGLAKIYPPRKLMVAATLERRQAFAAASAAGEAALRAYPTNLACRLVVSRCSMATGAYDVALAHALEACRLHPKVWFAHAILAAVYDTLSRLPEALAAAEAALALSAGHLDCVAQVAGLTKRLPR